ncbi:MAG: DUF3617 family protein [Terracidiphilus sp.]|jgi:hypothetical protein
MTFSRSAFLGLIVLGATGLAPAQQKFPLRPGEWVARITTAGAKTAPMVLRLCLNDESWLKTFARNPSCSVEQLTFSSKGATYSLDCPLNSFQMKGTVDVTFEGPQHMVARSSMDMTMGGSTAHSVSVLDYRYKGPTCSPDDVNLKSDQPQ